MALHTNDKEKIAFITGQGLWLSIVTPFILCNTLE
jgi:hypothetical protein